MKLHSMALYNTFTVPCEKSQIVSFAFSIKKNIVVFPAQSMFAVKLICWITLGSESRFVVYLNLLQSSYNFL